MQPGGTNPQSSLGGKESRPQDESPIGFTAHGRADGAAALVAHWSGLFHGAGLGWALTLSAFSDRFQGEAAMRSGGRGRPRLRVGERGLLERPSPPKRRLLPRAQLLPLLLLALTVASVFYTIWSSWHSQTEELPLGRELRVRTGGDTGAAEALTPCLPFPRVSWGRPWVGLTWLCLHHMALAAGASVSVLRAHTPFQRNEASGLFCNSGYPVRESGVIRLGVLGSNPKVNYLEESLSLAGLRFPPSGLPRAGQDGFGRTLTESSISPRNL